MANRFLTLAALCLFLAVGLGAFGAHGLRGRIDEAALAVYQTAVQYQFWHGLGLALVAILSRHDPGSRLLCWSGWLLVAGIALFSGSLYLLVASGARGFGAVTPVGGLSFLAAWLVLVVYAWRRWK